MRQGFRIGPLYIKTTLLEFSQCKMSCTILSMIVDDEKTLDDPTGHNRHQTSTVLVIHGHPRGDDDQKTAVEAILTDREKNNIYITFTYIYQSFTTYMYQSFTHPRKCEPAIFPGSAMQSVGEVMAIGRTFEVTGRGSVNPYW